MQVNRRQFVQTALFAGTGLVINPFKGFAKPNTSSLFSVNPFILQNPGAVFVMKTNGMPLEKVVSRIVETKRGCLPKMCTTQIYPSSRSLTR